MIDTESDAVVDAKERAEIVQGISGDIGTVGVISLQDGTLQHGLLGALQEELLPEVRQRDCAGLPGSFLEKFYKR